MWSFFNRVIPCTLEASPNRRLLMIALHSQIYNFRRFANIGGKLAFWKFYIIIDSQTDSELLLALISALILRRINHSLDDIQGYLHLVQQQVNPIAFIATFSNLDRRQLLSTRMC
jgi:hypothetical protein